jgi:peptidoglycan hydrolase-like protein with peptidoglycan-binding domain
MRYPVRVAIAGLAVALVVLAVGAADVSANPQLAGLQVALARKGLYSGAVDAVPGPLTEAAVLRFQEHAHLVPDGIVGPKTRRALGRFGRPLFGTRVIAPGRVGWDVAVLQYLLARRRLLATRPDGEFGARTEAAVIRFQRARGLVPDGVVGPATVHALCHLSVCAWSPAKAPDAAPVAQPVTKVTVRSLIDRWAAYYGVDNHLVRGLAWQESGFQQSVVSKQGAVGVMQITPETWSYVEAFVVGHPVSSGVDGNVQIGVAYLHYLLGMFGGDAVRAVGAYYQGPASVSVNGISAETQVYVDDVLALAQRL